MIAACITQFKPKEGSGYAMIERNLCHCEAVVLKIRGVLWLKLAIAGFANTTYKYIGLGMGKALRQLHRRYAYMVKAVSGAAFVAHKVNMVIVMMTLGAVVFAKGVTYGIIGCWYGMDNALFHKSLQRSVNGNTVKLLPRKFFNIGMRKCTIGVVKKFQYAPAAVCNT
jgi:hypothetical protein